MRLRFLSRDRVYRRLLSESQLSVAFVVLNALAAVIASYSLLVDSVPGVIGAMLVATLLGPLVALGFAIVDGSLSMFRRAFVTLLIGCLVVVLVSFVIGLIHRDIPPSHELLARTHPGLADLVIAMAGGAVGALAVLSPGINVAVVGVAVATALVPPLCAGGLLLARADISGASGALLLMVTNGVAIQVSVAVVLWVCGYGRRPRRHVMSLLLADVASMAMLGALAVGLAFSTHRAMGELMFTHQARLVISEKIESVPGNRLADVVVTGFGQQRPVVIRALVRGVRMPSAVDVTEMEKKLSELAEGDAVLRVRFMKVEVITRDGMVSPDDGDTGLPRDSLQR